MREIHYTIITATLAAALLQLLASQTTAEPVKKLACTCAPRAIPS